MVLDLNSQHNYLSMGSDGLFCKRNDYIGGNDERVLLLMRHSGCIKFHYLFLRHHFDV